MARRLFTVLLSLLLCAALTGCAGFTYQSINELLIAPVLGGGLDEIQKALTDYHAGAEPQYKYPKEGDWRSPLLQADLDGDGQQEAVLLYSLPGTASANACVAVLQQLDGAWQVVQDVQGMAGEVASMEAADLLGDGTRQLIVGYGSGAAKTFGVYTFRDGIMELLFQRDYSRYEIGDFTGRGEADLVVMSRPEELGGITLEYITSRDGQFVTDAPPVTLDTNFKSCDNLVTGIGPDGSHLLVVDGRLLADDRMFSQIVYFSGEIFYSVDNYALRDLSARYNSQLLSRDIDGDGMVEIPIRAAEVSTPSADKRLEFVRWMDFVTTPVGEVRQYGLMDSDRVVYIGLPMEWDGAVEVTDGDNKGEWQMRDAATENLLLTLRVLEAGEALPPGAQRVPGSADSYLVFGGRLTEEERAGITMTLMS